MIVDSIIAQFEDNTINNFNVSACKACRDMHRFVVIPTPSCHIGCFSKWTRYRFGQRAS